MKKAAEIVVIGGGIMGLSVAYNLARMGARDVILCEKSYLGSGSTGRCGSGIRAQYARKERIVVGREAIKVWENLSEELGSDVKFKQGGYMYLLYSQEEVDKYKEYVRLQNSLGVPTRLITMEEAQEIVPNLNLAGAVGATFNPKDGKADPFRTVCAYANAAKKMGVEINMHTEVLDLKRNKSGKWNIITNKGEMESGVIVLAAGSWSSLLAQKAGVDVPVRPFVEEAIVTEPVAEGTVGPLVNIQSHLFNYLWFTQTTVNHGIIAGWGHMQWVPEVISFDMTVSQKYVKVLAANMLKVMPGMANIKIYRHFSGFYDITPDREPILGEVPGLNLYVAVAAAFMHPPICGKAMAELILEGQSKCVPIDAFSLERFKGEVKALVY